MGSPTVAPAVRFPAVSLQFDLMIGDCESCGDNEEDLTLVQRVYLTPADWDREEKVEVAEGTEHWCAVCLLHYPHQVV